MNKKENRQIAISILFGGAWLVFSAWFGFWFEKTFQISGSAYPIGLSIAFGVPCLIVIIDSFI